MCRYVYKCMYKLMHNVTLRRTKIRWSADDGFSEGLFSDDACKAKVTQLGHRHATLGREQNVLWLEVAVDYVFLVEVLQRHQDLEGGEGGRGGGGREGREGGEGGREGGRDHRQTRGHVCVYVCVFLCHQELQTKSNCLGHYRKQLKLQVNIQHMFYDLKSLIDSC